MANTDLERDRIERERRMASERQRIDMREGTRDRGAYLVTARETRRSFVTTEFWLSLAMAVALIVVAYADEGGGLEVPLAFALASGVIGLYAISRGLAKAGSRDPQVKHIDLD